MENILLQLKSKPYEKSLNKLTIPKTILKYTDADIELFNNIIDFIKKEEFLYVDFCKSGSFSYAGNLNYISRYSIAYSPTKQSIELVIASKKYGCYRVIMGHEKKEGANLGTKALEKFYKLCRDLNIDLEPYALTEEEGLEVKKTIKKPHIQAYEVGFIFGAHHLDFNSSHPAGIAERNPELRPVFELMYAQRKIDASYKDIMNLTQGIMQSEFCIDFRDTVKKTKRAPYQFAGLSRDANNRTREMVELYINKLEAAGRKVILTNTDGIWYTGAPYHDELEGTKLGQWKTDYSGVTLCIKSSGTYQILDHGKVINRCRGNYALDLIKPREEWKFGEILTTTEVLYKYDPDTRHIFKKEN